MKITVLEECNSTLKDYTWLMQVLPPLSSALHPSVTYDSMPKCHADFPVSSAKGLARVRWDAVYVRVFGDIGFLQALDQLFEARRILGFSYVFAFFMFGNAMFRDEISPEQNDINKNLFENQQQAMEALVSLSESNDLVL